MTEKSLREQLEESFNVAENIDTPEPYDVVVEEPVATVAEEQIVSDASTSAPEPEEPVAAEPPSPVIEAPQAWTAENKAEWSKLPPSVQAEITRRENDFHKMVTKHDGELRFGRSMKEAYAPFEGTLQKYGAEPVSLMKELLGTVQALKEGDQNTKLQIMQNIARTYGVDMNGFVQQQQNPLERLYGEINQLKSSMNPDNIINQLQERQEADRIQSEVNAFAANPANKHFESVKAPMASLLQSGQAKDLQEAYDMACWANPNIRSTMMQQQTASAKQKADIAQKKNAAASIKGSPSVISGNQNPPSRNLREELAAQMDAALGSKI